MPKLCELFARKPRADPFVFSAVILVVIGEANVVNVLEKCNAAGHNYPPGW